MTSLDEILELEESLQLEAAFQKYRDFYANHPSDVDIWKHYYFFLWFTEVEGQSFKGGIKFTEQQSIDKLLRPVFEEGHIKFKHLAEFNFIAGYTISLFPYYYGDYQQMETYGHELLNIATKLDPLNPLYKAVYLGSFPIEELPKDYAYYWNLTKTTIWPKYLGKGFLNVYIRDMISKAVFR